MYSYTKEDYEKVNLQIIKKDDSFKFQMVAAKDDVKSIKTYFDVNNKTAKGVKKNIIKKEIIHNNYKNVLFCNEKMLHQMRSIRSERHQISSYHLNKVSLSPFDDKRYILNDGITSFAYGNKNIKKNDRIMYMDKLIGFDSYQRKINDAIEDLEIQIVEKRKQLKELRKQLKEIKNTYYIPMLDLEKIEKN